MNSDFVPVRCGRVVLVGRTNTGKSSLLNSILEDKISITTALPQTTRGLVCGVLTQQNSQAIFVDTPGVAKHQHSPLNKIMHRQMLQGIWDAEVAIFVLDANHYDERDFLFLRELSKSHITTLAALNKMDKLRNKNLLFPLATLLQQRATDFAVELADIFPVSARTGEGVERLGRRAMELLPIAPFAYSKERGSLSTEPFIAAELLREQLFHHLVKELPFSLCVICDSIKKEEVLFISLTVLVTKTSHKPIVLGKGGLLMKKVASAARIAMEDFFARKVMLKVRVRVEKNWSGDTQRINKSVLDAEGLAAKIE